MFTISCVFNIEQHAIISSSFRFTKIFDIFEATLLIHVISSAKVAAQISQLHAYLMILQNWFPRKQGNNGQHFSLYLYVPLLLLLHICIILRFVSYYCNIYIILNRCNNLGLEMKVSTSTLIWLWSIIDTYN